MKKALSVFLAVVMTVSLLSCFALGTAAETTKDTFTYNVPKTSTTPKMDGNVDSVYKQIFKMKGSQCIDKDGKTTDNYPLDGNSNSKRYDAVEHPSREASDWWNCEITGYAAWDATYLYLIVDVKNAGQLDDNPDANWAGDGIQVAVHKNGKTTDYTFAQNEGNIVAAMNLGNTLGSAAVQKKKAYDTNKFGKTPTGFIKVSDAEKGNYTYELALEWSALGVKSSDAVNFNVSINLNDENMVTDAFCGFQVSKGIFNETSQSTKPGMAYAASMIFEGEGGNKANTSTTPSGSESTTTPGGTTTTPENNGGSTTTPDNGNSSGNGETNVDTPVTEESEVIKNAKLALSAAEQAIAEIEDAGTYDADAVADLKAAYDELAAALNAETVDETEVAALQKAYEDLYNALVGSNEPVEDDKKDDEQKPADDKKDDKTEEKGGFPVWIIVVAVVAVVVIAAAVIFFVVCKGDVNKLKALFGKKQ